MSFSTRSIREIPGEPSAKFADEISKRLSRFLTKDQLDFLDNKEDIYTDGQDVDEVVRFHDELLSTKTFDFVTKYYPPGEPDLDKLKLWVRARNTGSNNATDWSGYDNECLMVRSEPILMDGSPFDYGIHTGGVKSICQRFNAPNRDTTNLEHYKITDNARLQVSGISTGISYFIRFRILDLAAQDGLERTLFEKIDDSTPNNAAMLKVSVDGRLKGVVKQGGSTLAMQTAAGTIAVNTVYEVWLTYDVTGSPTMHIYVNNVDKTLTTDAGAVNWQANLTNHDLFLFRRGFDTTGGYVYGDFYDFELFREKVVSATEVSHHFTNKWTLSDIAFGQVMIAGYWATYHSSIIIPPTTSYNSLSYTATSYTTYSIVGGASFTITSFTSTSFDT